MAPGDIAGGYPRLGEILPALRLAPAALAHGGGQVLAGDISCHSPGQLAGVPAGASVVFGAGWSVVTEWGEVGVPFLEGEIASGEVARGGGEVFGVEVPDRDRVAADGDGHAVGAERDSAVGRGGVDWDGVSES